MFICEVKTALQGPQIADRQNTNNSISALKRIFNRLQELGEAEEKEWAILLMTTSHNTRNQWWRIWIYLWCGWRTRMAFYDHK